ncbi:MAG: PAS domain S-box protein, partial [Pontibacter sp.]|nr:PAS domain S-box protein [Pontibacter sp.]
MHQLTSQQEISPTLEPLRLERLNRLLFNHYPDAVYTVNMDGTFHNVNHTVCRLLKRDKRELLGQGYQLHIHPEHWEAALHYFRSAGEGHPQRYQLVVRSSAGESVHLDVTTFPLKVAGQVAGIFGIARNITEQKEREQALL